MWTRMLRGPKMSCNLPVTLLPVPNLVNGAECSRSELPLNREPAQLATLEVLIPHLLIYAGDGKIPT